MWTAGRGAALTRVAKVVALLATCAVLTVAGLHGRAASPPGSTRDTAGPAGAAHPVVLLPVTGGTPCPAVARTTALVRTPAGRTLVVSFARGWAVYNGRVAGTLLRVCPAAR